MAGSQTVETANKTPYWGVLFAACLGACSGGGAPSPPAGAPNVLLISIDSLRRDRLGVYGHRPEFAPDLAVSPRLDELAGEALVFDDAWSPTSWTLPSHMSLMTGLEEIEHGVTHNDWALDPLRETLAQRLQAAGYRTCGVYSGPLLDPRYGFGRGFDLYLSAMEPPERQAQRIREALGGELSEEELGRIDPQFALQLKKRLRVLDVTSPRVNELAVEFLERLRSGERFFLFLHYFDVHHEYVPERADPELAARFDPDYRGEFSGENWLDRLRAGRPPSSRDLAHLRALYDAEIHWVDRHVGEILDFLKQRGLYDHTLVVVTADHGDEFLEHGGVLHAKTLFPEVTRVPLLLRRPGGDPGGRRLAGLAQLQDLAPTVLDLAGLASLAEASGASLRPLWEGGASRASAHFRLTIPGAGGRNYFLDGWRDQRYAVLRSFAALDASPRLLVYDRAADPTELQPLAAGDPRYGAAWDAYCAVQRQRAAPALARSPWQQLLLPDRSAEEQQLLAELGYAELEVERGAAVPIGLYPSSCD